MMSNQKNQPPRGQYILNDMMEIAKNGDAYTTEDALYQYRLSSQPNLNFSTFHSDLCHLQTVKKIYVEGRRIYLMSTWRYEEAAAHQLAQILAQNQCHAVQLPDPLTVMDVTLTQTQRQAVELALHHHVSLILGGAGTGKSTLVNAIARNQDDLGHVVLCAPTGKAARNLTARTGLPARTVHSALGMKPDDDFLTPVVWNFTRLVVVDEASMLTLEMLAGILDRMNSDCQLVLVGDPNQLLSVGAGNVLADLMALGFPSATLETTHRQNKNAKALTANVTNFTQLQSVKDLAFDASFRLVQAPVSQVSTALTQDAIQGYLAPNSNVQVLSPVNRGDLISVQGLNRAIAPKVNPRPASFQGMPTTSGPRLWSGDRVMITQNNRDQDCSNGDVGEITVCHMHDEIYDVTIYLDDGRLPTFTVDGKMQNIIQAYAITVHKSQGSEYDTVYIPITKKYTHMLTRNWLYTAISRAKKQVVLYGDMEALDMALQTLPKQRRSKLVAKVRMYLYKAA